MTALSSAPVAQMLRMVRPAKEYTQMDGTIAEGFTYAVATTNAEMQFHHRAVADADATPGHMLAVLQARSALDKVCAEFRGGV